MHPRTQASYATWHWLYCFLIFGLISCGSSGDDVSTDPISTSKDSYGLPFDVDSLCATFDKNASLNGFIGDCMCQFAKPQLAGADPVEEPIPAVPSQALPCPPYPPPNPSITYWNNRFGADTLEPVQGQLAPGVQTMGWHPYWMGTAYRSYPFDMLSTVAYFGYQLDPATGSYTDIGNWKITGLVDSAQKAGTEVLLSVVGCGASELEQFLASKAAQQTLADSLNALLSLRQAQGITLHFDQVPAYAGTAFVDFVRTLGQALPGYKIVLSLPSADPANAYDVAALRPLVSFFTVECSAYEPPEEVVQRYVLRGLDPAAVVLAFPYLGSVAQTAAIESELLEGLPWADAKGDAVWYRDTHELHQAWQSVGLSGVRGVGVWPLGYDQPKQEYWYLVENALAPGSPLLEQTVTYTQQEEGGIDGLLDTILELVVFMAEYSTFSQQVDWLLAVLSLWGLLLLGQAWMNPGLRAWIKKNKVVEVACWVALVVFPVIFLKATGLFAAGLTVLLILAIVVAVGFVLYKLFMPSKLP